MIRTRKKFKKVKKNCNFCKEKTNPDYKEYLILEKFLNERGKILSCAKTGICSKHQRKLSQAIKRARFLALLPFSTSVY